MGLAPPTAKGNRSLCNVPLSTVTSFVQVALPVGDQKVLEEGDQVGRGVLWKEETPRMSTRDRQESHPRLDHGPGPIPAAAR